MISCFCLLQSEFGPCDSIHEVQSHRKSPVVLKGLLAFVMLRYLERQPSFTAGTSVAIKISVGGQERGKYSVIHSV